MKRIAELFIIQFLGLGISALGQHGDAPDKGWNWIIPLVTNRSEIERTFGKSITEDKTDPFQTYVAEFGKINVAYTVKSGRNDLCTCDLSVGTVLHFFVSPTRHSLAQLDLDLSKFKVDATYSPREIVYFSESLGLLISTKIVQLQEKKVEQVVALRYRPKKKSGP